ncbi:ubiquitin-conjugating enzyme E2 24 [Pyrus ussuriensis x Pyrus communis]|uniref:Ubiquitin-conjugating enzyme E2 24 n=1 Tax=Pyrus ussuriensis x Pyrus communis TaxID=2448454 RepID=A0A5N5IB10_9ROSA|nr:ubiquitin-conjugating enzyme E2 24 [Pyrus ussuriensis x Pyrus communis]
MKANIFEERTSVYLPLAASEKQGKPRQEKVKNTANNTEKTSESHQKLTIESRPRTQLLGTISAVSFSRENHRKELRKNWDSRYGDAAAARFEPILRAVYEPPNRCWAQWIGAHAETESLLSSGFGFS